MNAAQQEEFPTNTGEAAPVSAAGRQRSVAVRRLSQNAPCGLPQDTTLLVQVNDAEYRALARQAQLNGCSVEMLVAGSIRSLLEDEA